MTVPDPAAGDTKRLFLALGLSLVVLFFAQQFILPPATTPIDPAEEESQAPQRTVANQKNESQPLPLFKNDIVEKDDIVGVEREIVLKNEALELRFSTRGSGQINSIRLLKYLDEGEPLELLPQNLPSSMPRPLQIKTKDSQIQRVLDQAVYKAHVINPLKVRFVYQQLGIRAEKTVTLPRDGYVFEVTTQLVRGGESLPVLVSLGAGMGPIGETLQTDFSYPGIATGINQEVERYTEADIPSALTMHSRDWLAIDSQYFARAFAADPLEIVHLDTHPVQLEVKEKSEQILFSASASTQPREPLTVFFGPKEIDTLRGANPKLVNLINFGWLSFLVKPLLYSLKWVYSFVGNYGISIIILTFLISIAMVPLRYKQIVSMKKMTVLQPQLKAIQNRYKGLSRRDPKRGEMNKEVMALYKEHGANPLSSCLPLILQMPFLFAFYQMLWNAVELRGAPFMLWVDDLSKYDPYYVTPLLMGVTMFAQQRMTPGTGDPAQQKMMMMMPVVMTAIFLRVSSGLALYFLCSNVFGMLFQVCVQKLSPELSKTPAKLTSNPKKDSKGSKKRKK